MRENQQQPSGDFTWNLECWRPLQCVIEDQTATLGNMFDLIPDHNRGENRFISLVRSSMARVGFLPVSARTMVLPWSRDMVTYTFLPLSIGGSAVFFVTSMLSGCGVFVAKPDKPNCNLIVLHANVYCRNMVTDDVDYHHFQGKAVLEKVNSMNDQCQYRLSVRWAPSDHEPVIDQTLQGYHYEQQVQYYRGNYYHFLYAFNYGGFLDKWMFCIKTIALSRAKGCFYI